MRSSTLYLSPLDGESKNSRSNRSVAPAPPRLPPFKEKADQAESARLLHTLGAQSRTRAPTRAHGISNSHTNASAGIPTKPHTARSAVRTACFVLVLCRMFASASEQASERASERACVRARECTGRPGGPRLPGPPEPPSPCRPPRPRASEARAARHVRMRTSTRNARARTGAGTHAGGVCRGGRLWLSSARNSAHAFDVTKMCTDS